MNGEKTYKASCFCGDVQFSLEGEPEAMAYCHCDSCRHWSAGPVSAFTLWKPESLKITRGKNNIGGFNKNPGTESEEIVSVRKWCKNCGGHLFTEHPVMQLIDVPAVVIEGFEFKPSFHVNYQETIHSMKDGLPKFKDLPAEAGGSGTQLNE